MNTARALATAILLALFAASCSSADEGSDGGARYVCHEFVKDRLKSPGSADFSGESVEESGTQQWAVVGVVDSQNSFGAMIRNTYSCTVRYAGNDEWRLVSLESTEN